ncbi:D-psicose/D-tagatose/L-ribulose 3-epimerase [Roseiarcus fermentans]|uniref:D-psicose/D-tagatose/L-ribulose 3-epimerase n=1 Tax=Roseiarcus fermentans TaxID=1473586 RepID=A0A366FU30_9HYPH|nr:sugar phosphate isomerase/epimerase family protein [Roseiarcus fermentans]RBP18128.1 D-psicose/D-tagatose/L-ribulose 3-epimerase [Roseiarcus fermentans]
MTNTLGVHSLLFTDAWTAASAKAAIDCAARVGFDAIEVLIFDPATIDVAMTRRLARDAGIAIALGMALGVDSDISSLDPAVARRGEATVRRCLDIAEEIGAPCVSGIAYAAFNRYSAPPSEAQKNQVRSALARLDGYAGGKGLKLGLEAVNRYESYLVNTLDEAGALIRSIGARNLFVHMDTFHMNIEETDIAGAIARNADLLGYAHVADNTRGTLGAGGFDFKAFFGALARAGYTGGVTVESFSNARLGPGLAGAIALWRCQWSDAEATAREALAFMRAELAAAAHAARPW